MTRKKFYKNISYAMSNNSWYFLALIFYFSSFFIHWVVKTLVIYECCHKIINTARKGNALKWKSLILWKNRDQQWHWKKAKIMSRHRATKLHQNVWNSHANNCHNFLLNEPHFELIFSSIIDFFCTFGQCWCSYLSLTALFSSTILLVLNFNFNVKIIGQ